MTDILNVAAFMVEKTELEDRPTQSTAKRDEGVGGRVKQMDAGFLHMGKRSRGYRTL